MSVKDEILSEIIDLLPEFRGKEQELKDIIDKLLQSQPKIEMDSEFKEKLRKKVVEEAKKKKKIVPFYKKLYFIVPSGVSVAAVLLFAVLIFFNPTIKSAVDESDIPPVLETESVDQTEATQEDTFFSDSDGIIEDINTVTNTQESNNTDINPEGAPGNEGTTPLVSQEQDLREDLLRLESEVAELLDYEAPIETKELYDISESRDEAYPLQRASELYSGDTERFELESNEMSFGFAPEPEVLEEPSVYPDSRYNTEEYTRIYENDFLTAINDPVSTFSIDVDTASYSNTRRYLNQGYLPPADAVRIEELVNYFDFGYPEVESEHPFDFNTALSTCPWNEDNMLLYVGVQGERKAFEELPPNNLVFLLDVSGSMSDANKLPLLKQSLQLLTKQLRPQDRVSIVVYAGAAGVVLSPTAGNDTKTIIAAFDVLEAGGSTAGGEGIELAYALAEENFMESGNNRIIVATDGDFNVGPSSTSETTRLIEEKRDNGIFLTVLGFGMGNYKDSRMEQMADNGNGNYAYIDNIMEAKKVLVQEISSTLFTIASDVKIQIEFNPNYVQEYRLIGYENRVMANQDFSDDTKDAGELGAGHTVTAIYEIVPANDRSSSADELRYQSSELNDTAATSGEIMTIKFRYKDPGDTVSTLIEEPVQFDIVDFNSLDDSFRFAAAVAQWGMLLRGSQYLGTSTYESVLEIARDSDSYDPYGLKSEFINLVELSQYLQ